VIRAATERDVHAIARIYAHYVRETPITFDLEPPAEAVWRERIASRYPWFVIEADGEVAGWASGGPFRPKAAYEHTLETSIYLDPTHWGRGLGRPLYGALLAEATARGFHVAIAGVTVPNDRSVALHERLGFTRAGTFAEVGRKFEAWHDVAFFRRALA